MYSYGKAVSVGTTCFRNAQPEIANLLPLWIWSVVFLIYFGKAGPLGLRVSEKTGEESGLEKMQKF